MTKRLVDGAVLLGMTVLAVRLVEMNHAWWTILPVTLGVAFAFSTDKTGTFPKN